MSFTPYIFFDGTCSEAIDFYAEVFGADNVMKMPYSEAPPDVGLPPSEDRLMHAQINVGDTVFMCSDNPEGSPKTTHAGFAVSHVTETLAEAQKTFAKLSDGGTIVMPFEATFFTEGFGMCNDKFGTPWMIMVEGETPNT